VVGDIAGSRRTRRYPRPFISPVLDEMIDYRWFRQGAADKIQKRVVRSSGRGWRFPPLPGRLGPVFALSCGICGSVPKPLVHFGNGEVARRIEQTFLGEKIVERRTYPRIALWSRF
jgi:hypothetical protein